MRFEARELKPYAEPVSTPSLKQGEVYFSIQYADEALLVPVIETLVFAGRNLDNRDPELLYFQDAESYRQGIRYGSDEAEKASFQLGRDGKVNHIFEYEHALEELMKCSLRRRTPH
jgi:hypothetical protein